MNWKKFKKWLKKLDYAFLTSTDYGEHLMRNRFRCPECKRKMEYKQPRCDNCRQAPDWSTTKLEEL